MIKTIKEFVEKDKLELPLLIKDCKNGTTSKGAPYLSLILQDRSGTIDGKFWDVKPEEVELAKVGTIANFTFEVLLYNQNRQVFCGIPYLQKKRFGHFRVVYNRRT